MSQTNLPRFLCIQLRHWPIVRAIRRQKELLHRPVVVVGMIRQRRVILDACAKSQFHSVRVGMTLAEARALCAGLHVIDHQADADRRALTALGRWLTRFSPTVSMSWSPIDKHELPEPNVLFLDLTGSERLLGTPARILDQISKALNRFGIDASLAIAPTPGAAWAFASSNALRVVDPDRLSAQLSHLPITAMRINARAISSLNGLGIHTIGQLLALPRDALPSRFGQSLLTRIDQLTGTLVEPLVAIPYEVPINAVQEFDFRISALESIWLVFGELTLRIVLELGRRGHGTTKLRLTCKPEPCSGREPISRTIAISRPTRHQKTIFDLIRRATERLEDSANELDGFVSFRIDVLDHQPITDEQTSLVDDEDGNCELEIDQLCDRLRVQLGESAVIRPIARESYLPERAWCSASAGTPANSETVVIEPTSTRPLRLLPTPLEIRVTSEPHDDREG
ncbi:MAG TPA: DNA polymerase Y family protein, partial [Tepidisphaeraceae bacterium]|nr:DNA polymerase Y family protein [Tepidisphaeraceae bacterium]